MIKEKVFDKPISNLENWLMNHPEYFATDSMEYAGLHYVLWKGEFYVVKRDCGIKCEIPEVPEMAKRLLPEIRAEVLALYEDIKGLGLEREWT